MYTVEDITHETWTVTGLSTRVASLGQGPVALFIHGWPECWFTWRQQMVALANAGYRAIAPDMPGFSQTEALPNIADYNVVRICDFMRELLIEASGGAAVLLIGHDWGAINCWQFTLRHPELVSRLVNMSVPLHPIADQPPTALLREHFKDNFFYQLYFQQPGVAEAEFDADPEGILRALYCSPDTPRDPPVLGRSIDEGGGWIGRLGKPQEQPSWLTHEALAYYVAAYRHSGFAGGINYYRNLDENWRLMQPYRDTQITCPVLFLVGSADSVIRGASEEQLQNRMSRRIPDLQILMLPGKGHWIQSEACAQVNAALLEFAVAAP
ncbi:alpha/beta fold hydrolase [Halopseudomonas pelagia]|uniref:Alpha/beta hydrolase n=1 Tax=Halopseudomonas pelagia TaxID=553151 RepID=A0AA91U035_9GAMM|nr:alpha/beta hydrolase [Halopseudomonas pelagia]PCC98140.1 epoxide hydrolase [Halopseudomonas pelagia]QFY55046.1 alpha/beta hydrolase [Halopseudomonas pelagia]